MLTVPQIFTNSISLGLAALGRPGYINLNRVSDFQSTQSVSENRSIDEMKSQAFEVLDTFYACGGRHVDVARSYGNAELFCSDWIKSRMYDDVCVSSKWGYKYTGKY